MFTINKLKQCETRRGCYFSCNLLLDGKNVAEIENKGDGGCTWIYFDDKSAEASWVAQNGNIGLVKSDNAIEQLIQNFEARKNGKTR